MHISPDERPVDDSTPLATLPVRALLRDRYDNAAKFPDIAMPILILHDRMDTLIPIAQAEDLARSRTGARSTTMSGPATPVRVLSSTRVTHGTIAP